MPVFAANDAVGLQAPPGAVDVVGMGSKPPISTTSTPTVTGWLGDATLSSLAELEAVIEATGNSQIMSAGRSHLNAIRGSIRLLMDAAGEGWSDGDQPNAAANFGEVAVSTLKQLGAEAESRGIVLRHEFSPSLQGVQFAPGGSILVGLVRQSLSNHSESDLQRQLTVTATVDGRCQVVIGIQDSAGAAHGPCSIEDLSQWQRRIAVLGGEFRLRSVPFGSGVTIEASVPARRIAA